MKHVKAVTTPRPAQMDPYLAYLKCVLSTGNPFDVDCTTPLKCAKSGTC
jgi:hypothetical protein